MVLPCHTNFSFLRISVQYFTPFLMKNLSFPLIPKETSSEMRSRIKGSVYQQPPGQLENRLSVSRTSNLLRQLINPYDHLGIHKENAKVNSKFRTLLSTVNEASKQIPQDKCFELQSSVSCRYQRTIQSVSPRPNIKY